LNRQHQSAFAAIRVAATNRDLVAAVKAGRFREDLYYRLAAFPIRVPPLRERREKIPTLALFFMEQVSRKLGLAFDGIAERDMERLCQHSWPGNVRELQHVIERAALLSDPPRLRVPPLGRAGLTPAGVVPHEESASRPEEWVSLEEVERRYVRRVLHHVKGRISGPGSAAEILQLKPTTLQFWIDRLGLRQELTAARRERKGRDEYAP
jgi:transcriptional regulator with GAF, ATPase, and Fis domain